MIVKTAQVRLYLPFAHSLKEKRAVIRSVGAKIKNKFNVSVAETEDQDLYQTAVLGVACVSGSLDHAEQMIDQVIEFIGDHCEAEIVAVLKETR